MLLKDKLITFRDKGFTYDTKSGDVYTPLGKKCSSLKSGYILCRLFDKSIGKHISIRAHQFAWFMTYNQIPSIIDHINRNRSDNRISNLRIVTRQQNNFNTDAKGFCWYKRDEKFKAQIQVDGKAIHLGYFNNAVDAREAYLKAKLKYHII